MSDNRDAEAVLNAVEQAETRQQTMDLSTHVDILTTDRDAITFHDVVASLAGIVTGVAAHGKHVAVYSLQSKTARDFCRLRYAVVPCEAGVTLPLTQPAKAVGVVPADGVLYAVLLVDAEPCEAPAGVEKH